MDRTAIDPCETTTRRRRSLPGPTHASGGLPWAESAAFVAVVPLLSVPVMLATMAATWAAVLGVALTAAVVWACLARRVAVGQDWVAERRLWRWRVSHHSQVRAVELVETAHGGTLHVHLHGGRTHRLRRSELASSELRTALGGLVTSEAVQVGRGVPVALGLPEPVAA